VSKANQNPIRNAEDERLLFQRVAESSHEKQLSRIFNAFLDGLQKSHGFTAVNHAVIVRQGHVHHWANFNLK
jgi:hypothetical protein